MPVAEQEDEPRCEPERPATPRATTAESGLNARQKEAWPVIRKRERVTRKEYQEIVGGELSSRTAIYDLQDLVKLGRGPSTMYEVAG